jgi:hypothetical protein
VLESPPDGTLLSSHVAVKACLSGLPRTAWVSLKRGNNVMTYKGNMGDEREFDEKAAQNRIDIFLESLGIGKPKD